MSRAERGLKVGVVGATGLVGGVLLDILERRRFPVGTLAPFSSGRAGAAVRFRSRTLPAPGASFRSLRGLDLVFLVSSDEVARRYGRALAAAGAWVIDDSSAFRLEPGVPLVIPEVNADALSAGRRLIAGPNCTVTGAAVAGYPLHRRYGLRELRIASYQSVSGAGRAALEELYGQVRREAAALRDGSAPTRLRAERTRALPHPIAFNIFPQVGGFDERGECSEEVKVRAELRKLWSAPSLRVSATTVRVPSIRSHALAVWMGSGRRLSPAAARALLRRAPGVRLWRGGAYPTARSAAGTDLVHVARVRAGASGRELALWVVSDNLRIGAALNSVRIAELLLARGWLRPRRAASRV